MSTEETRITRIAELAIDSGEAGACLVVIYGAHLGHKYEVLESVLMGRGDECDIVLTADSVSRKHALAEPRANGTRLRDLDSTNGTYVNDEPVQEAMLRHGDLVKVGDTIFKYLAAGNIEQAYHEEIYRMTIMDGLTGAYNRRYVQEYLEREVARAHRYNRALSVVMLDIDHLKRVNDQLGDVTGDFVLREVSELARRRIRREEVFARYGGEEFCIVLPETASHGALTLAEHIRELVESHAFEFDGDVIPVTLSAGVAQLRHPMRDWTALVEAADTNLYRAKGDGRNKVVCDDGAT